MGASTSILSRVLIATLRTSLLFVVVFMFGLVLVCSGFFFSEGKLHQILIFILRIELPLLLAAFKYTALSQQGSFHSKPGVVVYTAAP